MRAQMNLDDIYLIPLVQRGAYTAMPERVQKWKDRRMAKSYTETEWPGWLKVEQPTLEGSVRTHVRWGKAKDDE